MAFCTNCGSQIPEGSAFCPSCGTRIDAGSQPGGQPVGQPMGQYAGQPAYQTPVRPVRRQTNVQSVRQPVSRTSAPVQTGSNRGMILAVIGVVALLLIILVVVLIVKGSSKSIDAEPFVSIETRGFDGYGKLEASLDKSELKDEIFIVSSKMNEKAVNKLVQSMKVELSEQENLSNGQEVTVTLKYNKDLAKEGKIKFAKDEWKYTVDGLDSIREIDPFADFKYSIDGVSPEARFNFDSTTYIDEIGYLNFEVDKREGIELGDTITVTCTSDEDYLLRNGYKLTEKTKTITVDALDRYVTSVEDLSDEVLSRMKKEAEDTVSAYMSKTAGNEYNYLWADGLEYEGVFIVNKKGNDYWGDENEVILVYSATWGSTRETDDNYYFDSGDVYYPIKFTNVIEYKDGTIDYERMTKAYGCNLDASDFGGNYLDGYDDTTKMFTDLVRSRTDSYTYEIGDSLKEYFK